MGKVFVHEPPRLLGKSKLPTEHKPDEAVVEKFREQQADDALLSQWAREEKKKKATERSEIRGFIRELTDLTRTAEAKTKWKIILLEPELVIAVDDVFEETKPKQNHRNIMRRVKRWTKGLIVTLPMMNKAITWQRDFAWNKYPCMGCGHDMGIGGLGNRVSYEVVIAMPGVLVGGLCGKCFKLEYHTKIGMIINRLNESKNNDNAGG